MSKYSLLTQTETQIVCLLLQVCLSLQREKDKVACFGLDTW